MPQTTPQPTDWDLYYRSVPRTARLTRAYTTSVLLRYLTRYGGHNGTIVEIGGANSCFLDAILHTVRPAHYRVIDNNTFGLSLLQQKGLSPTLLSTRNQNVLDLPLDPTADIVFSIGLIEHFDPPATAAAIQAHFRLLKPGGHAIISFPTPTLLYRLTRSLIERLGLWIFHDERPLTRAEVASTLTQLGTISEDKLLWPLLLTQRILVAQKPLSPDPPSS